VISGHRSGLPPRTRRAVQGWPETQRAVRPPRLAAEAGLLSRLRNTTHGTTQTRPQQMCSPISSTCHSGRSRPLPGRGRAGLQLRSERTTASVSALVSGSCRLGWNPLSAVTVQRDWSVGAGGFFCGIEIGWSGSAVQSATVGSGFAVGSASCCVAAHRLACARPKGSDRFSARVSLKPRCRPSGEGSPLRPGAL